MPGGPTLTDDTTPTTTRLARGQLELPPAALGLPDPPVSLQLGLVAREDGWRGVAWSLAQDPGLMSRWLTRQRGLQILDIEPGPGRSVVLALGDDHPAQTWLVQGPGWIAIQLAPGGPAGLTVTGTGDRLEAVLAGLSHRARVQDLEPPSTWEEPARKAGLLTDRQEAAVRWAMAAGYYEVPRGIRLQDLADQMGASIGALSTLLRRAEARLLAAYLDAEPLIGDLLESVALTREVPQGATWRTATDRG